MRQQVAILPDGRRLHLQDGPIDLIVEAFGARDAVSRAYAAAVARFATVLDELCAELPLLRTPVTAGPCPLRGAVARRMFEAAAPYATRFVTPMVAVAGSVAEAVLEDMTRTAPDLARAYVNNGGDIALHLAPGENFAVAMIDRPDRPSQTGMATIGAADGVRGIATSGWRGRSFSLGIADAVTVLAAIAPQADAAATMIANAVDLPDHPDIVRVPACDLQPDSDLGARPVTRDVPPLTEAAIDTALGRGLAFAETCRARGLIVGAALHLQGTTRTLGLPSTGTQSIAQSHEGMAAHG